MHIKVKVHPDSAEEEITKLAKDSFEIYIREPAQRGQANARVLKIIKDSFPDARQIRLVAGYQSQNKIIEVTD